MAHRSKSVTNEFDDSAVLCPFVLFSDLRLLLGREVVLDVEQTADLLWRFALDHVCSVEKSEEGV